MKTYQTVNQNDNSVINAISKNIIDSITDFNLDLDSMVALCNGLSNIELNSIIELLARFSLDNYNKRFENKINMATYHVYLKNTQKVLRGIEQIIFDRKKNGIVNTDYSYSLVRER